MANIINNALFNSVSWEKLVQKLDKTIFQNQKMSSRNLERNTSVKDKIQNTKDAEKH